MLNRYPTYYNPAIQFVVFCAILALSWGVSGTLIEFINVKVVGYSNAEILAMKEFPSALSNNLKFANILVLTIILFIPATLFAYLAYPKPAQYLGFRFVIKKYHLLWGIAFIIIALPFTSLLEEWSKFIPAIGNSQSLDDQYNQMATSMLKGNKINDLILNIVLMCIAPALIEEIFFRGCLQNILINWVRKSPIVSIIIVATLFSAFHGQLSGFFPRLFLGLLLGLGYYYSGSLWVSIGMHIINNLITVLFVYLYNAHLTQIDITKLPAMNLWFGLLSMIAVIGFGYLFYKDRNTFEILEVDKDE